MWPRRRAALALGALSLGALTAGCRASDGGGEPGVVVFRHPKLFGDPAPFDALIASFEQSSGLRVQREMLPASSDEQHLFYAINFQARSQAFDVAALDAIWVAEFAQAGWLRDLTPFLSAADREDVFPGPLASVTWNGRIHALPWFCDAGLLYYRADLLARHGLAPPRTWDELMSAARTVQHAGAARHGFVWQGKQYEGLVCNALEFIWSHGGDLTASQPSRDNATRGLALMRRLVTQGVTPAFVTTLTEEPSRVIFGRGDAVFLRNWPYAWRLFEREGSAVRGRIAVCSLPHETGHASASTLGGWQLGVSAFSTHAEAAERLAAFLASAPAQQAMALAYGYSPPRRSLYDDAALPDARPLAATLRSAMEAARPRPVVPGYVALSQVLQAEFSAVLTGTRAPEMALAAIERASAMLEAR